MCPKEITKLLFIAGALIFVLCNRFVVIVVDKFNGMIKFI
jgi:hypothetical protein